MQAFEAKFAGRLRKIRAARERRAHEKRRAKAASQASTDIANPRSTRRTSFGSTRTLSSVTLTSLSEATKKNGGQKVTKAWIKTFKRAAAERPYLKSFTSRKRSILFNLGVHMFPEETCRVAELSQNLKFSRILENVVPCLTPSGEKYLTNICRPIVGVEALRLQGMWWQSGSPFVEKFSDKLLRDLAGNAFESSCFAAAFFSTFLLRARLYRRRQVAQVGPEVPAARVPVGAAGFAVRVAEEPFSVSDSETEAAA